MLIKKERTKKEKTLTLVLERVRLALHILDNPGVTVVLQWCYSGVTVPCGGLLCADGILKLAL